MSSYELYAPDPAGVCERILPLNTIRNTVSYVQVTTFVATVKLSAPQAKPGKPDTLRNPFGPAGKMQASLALPLSQLDLGYSDLVQLQAVKLGRGKGVAGFDGTFLPAANPTPVLNALSVKTVDITNMEAIRNGEATIDGETVAVDAAARADLEHFGIAFVQGDGSGGPIRLTMALADVIVENARTIAGQRVRVDGQSRAVRLTDAGLDELRATGMAMAHVGSRPVRLVLGGSTRQHARRMMSVGFNGLPAGKKPKPPAPRPKLPAYRIGFVTNYQQEWELLGYSRGALLSSITLAPREQLSVEVFSFDRLRTEREQSFGAEFESNLETSALSRASTSVTSQVTQTLNAEAGVDAEISLPSIPVDPGVNASISNEVENSLNVTAESINEATRKASERFKATHQVRILETREVGTETRSIRRLQNPNFSRTLTLNYFEVLENYRVTTSLASTKRWCVLVPNPTIGAFDVQTVVAFENRLKAVLLSADVRAGFDAARILLAQQWFTDSLHKAELDAAEVEGAAATPATAAIPNKGVYSTARNLLEILDKFLALADGGIDDALTTLWNHYSTPPWEDSPVGKNKLREAETAISRYSFWLKMNSLYQGFEQRSRDYAHELKPLFDDVDNEDEVLRRIALLVDGLDDSWLYTVKMVAAATVAATLVGAAVNVLEPGVGVILSPIVMGLALLHDDLGLPAAIDKARQQLKPIEAAQAAQTLPTPAAATPPADGTTVVVAPVVPQVVALPDLAKANADFTALQLHLEANRVFYQNEIWRAEDVNARLDRLTLAGVAPFVENRLLGFSGSNAVLPLRLTALSDGVRTELLEKYAGFDPAQIGQRESTVALPTGGIQLESLLGHCDALEPYMQDRRDLDLRTRAAVAVRSEAEALQQIEEANRLHARLAQTPPLLDTPFAVVLPPTTATDSEFDDDG